jgi:hypothetical protein
VKGQRRKRILEIVVWCSFFIGWVCPHASACSYSSRPTKVGRRFSVQVVYQGKPIEGLQIELSTDPKGNEESRSLLTLITNARGMSEFAGIKPGSYYIAVKHDAFPYSEEIVVDSRGSKSPAEKITFEWPGTKPISIRSVAGLLNAQIRTESPLNDQAHPVFGPLGGAKLTLLRAVSGEIVESQTASESGAFQFQWVAAGLYLLHVEIAENASRRYRTDNGYVPIDVDPSGRESSLNLFLYPGVCGSLGYENRLETTTE